MKTNRLPRGQSGAALLVALIMLLISTMVGLASIRGTTMNEKMSSLAFLSRGGSRTPCG
jgi:type IV pilus assembly protein PilX